MEQGKRKREDDGGASTKSGKARKNDDGVKGTAVPPDEEVEEFFAILKTADGVKGTADGVKGTAVPPDEEVEEFFAILKRIHVAVKYFQERNGGRCAGRELTAAPWSLTFEREDFDGVKKACEGNKSKGLDLNSDPISDVSDHGD